MVVDDDIAERGVAADAVDRLRCRRVQSRMGGGGRRVVRGENQNEVAERRESVDATQRRDRCVDVGVDVLRRPHVNIRRRDGEGPDAAAEVAKQTMRG